MEFLNNLFVNIGLWFSDWLAGFLPAWATELVVGLIISIILIIIGFVAVLILTWGERKVIGRVQDRIGPNRWGPYGIFQPIADGIKMLTKEDIVPDGADYWVHLLAPIIIIVPALLIYAVLPFGDRLRGADLNIGILYIVALSTIGTIAILMAGWSSNNKYALLGAFRAVAQLIAYEIPMVLSIISVVLLTGSMSMVKIVENQTVPYIIVMPITFLVYMIAAAAELYRAPFDMVEADSELVAGYFTEYSGMKFVMFFMAEYVNLLAMAGIITSMFLGGWHFFGLEGLFPVLGPFIFFAKSGVVILIFWWIRSTFPRIRIDHMLGLAWKFLVPLSLANLMLVGLVDKLVDGDYLTSIVLLAVNLIEAAIVIAILSLAGKKTRSKRLQRITSRHKNY
ncbi:MAG: NADH-quinone oxidoreductase subunit NuoH [Chloroflexota bacterium]|nr:NADH-quinone oxidoreductase subunit NuoH [Chloroflexota bacterium]